MDTRRGASLHPTPWARAAASPELLIDAGRRVRAMGAKIGIGGRSPTGPWHVDVTNRDRRLRVWAGDIAGAIELAVGHFEAGADGTPYKWRAGADRIAHAHTRSPYALCGVLAVPERYGQPEAATCPGCLVALTEARMPIAN